MLPFQYLWVKHSPINRLAKQLVVQLQGKTKKNIIDSPKIIIENRFFIVNYQLKYRDFQNDLMGFHVKLSNRTDKDFIGKLAIQLCFNINEKEYSNTVLEQTINLSPRISHKLI